MVSGMMNIIFWLYSIHTLITLVCRFKRLPFTNWIDLDYFVECWYFIVKCVSTRYARMVRFTFVVYCRTTYYTANNHYVTYNQFAAIFPAVLQCCCLPQYANQLFLRCLIQRQCCYSLQSRRLISKILTVTRITKHYYYYYYYYEVLKVPGHSWRSATSPGK